MKKYGRQRQHQHGYENWKVPKGYVMWWEVECHDGKSKKTARQDARKEIEDELQLLQT